MVWGIAAAATDTGSKQPTYARIAQAAGALALLCSSGCNSLWGLDELDYRARIQDAGSEAGSCEGSLACYGPNGSTGNAPCNATGEPVASCDPEAAWIYCACDHGADVALFFEPDPADGPLEEVVLLAPAVSELYMLSIDGSCLGAATWGSCSMAGTCAEQADLTGYKLYRWNLSSFDPVHSPGTHTLAVFSNEEVTSDCSITELMSLLYIAPPEPPDAG